MGIDAENPLQCSLKHRREPDRHHDHRNNRLSDHRPQDHDLDRNPEHKHENQRQRHADPEWHFVFGKQRPAHPGAHQQQFALCEVDDLGRLVDQHKGHRDHAIQRADHKTVDQELDQELRVHGDA